MEPEQAATCLNCGATLPLAAPGRMRQFCDNHNRCKQAYHRRKLRDEREAIERDVLMQEMLRWKEWRSYDEATRATLTRLAHQHGTDAFLLALVALSQELQARATRPRVRAHGKKSHELEGEGHIV